MTNHATASSPPSQRRIYQGLAGPGIAIRARPRLFERLDLFAPGWPHHLGDEPCPFELTAQRHSRTGFRVTRAGLAEDGIAQGRSSAAALLSATLALAAIAQDPKRVLLHAAAVDTPAGLIVLLGETSMGKSTLAYLLGALSATLYCDDRLALDLHDAQGIALGLAPKLRFPLPNEIGDLLTHPPKRSLQWLGAALVEHPSGDAPLFGTKRPLAAMIFLNRNPQHQGSPDLCPLPPDQAFNAALDLVYLGPKTALEETLAMRNLFQTTPGYTLTFASTVQAAKSLSHFFKLEPR